MNEETKVEPSSIEEEIQLELNNKEEELYQESGKFVGLLNKSIRRVIVFGILSVIVFVLILFYQGNPLFIFDFANQNLNSTGLSRFFGLLTSLFFLFSLGYFLYFISSLVRIKRQVIPLPAIPQEHKKLKKQYNTFDLISVIPPFLFVLVLLNAFFFAPAVVDGQSMDPTFHDGDPVIIAHYHKTYIKDDIVILDYQGRLLIKRLIAKPGDTLVVSLQGIWVNGELIESDVRANGAGYLFLYDGVLKDGEYFVLGDNRNYSAGGTALSHDSRYFGFLSRDQILGKVVVKLNF